MEARRDFLEGRRIASYQLEREIGQGDMSLVYRAEDLLLNRTVALKLIAPELARDDSFRRRFTHEVREVASIDHPHIVPIYDVGEAEGVLYVAMRYIPGPNLGTLVREAGPLSVQTALRIAAQVASALDVAHEHHLVHRNVQPGNILVDTGPDRGHPEHAYLTDFGSTRRTPALTGFTTAGEFAGTLDYTAPEQISGRPVDGRSDLYSLACVVYETLTGGPPFERDEDLPLLWAHLYDQPPPLTGRRPEIAPATDEVLAKALAKAPEDRYDSCLEFVAAMRRVAEQPDGAPSGPLAARPSPPAPMHPPSPAESATPPGPPFDDDDDEW
ncbi:serine/threonine-protein kinase [Streptomyces sp. NPDC096339]|uniref:serine/threonine-protein kinase n=1 Tax=Streptomyces sp. NPDC096339 TaxID=3366086 RepID=UPI003803F1AD